MWWWCRGLYISLFLFLHKHGLFFLSWDLNCYLCCELLSIQNFPRIELNMYGSWTKAAVSLRHPSSILYEFFEKYDNVQTNGQQSYILFFLLFPFLTTWILMSLICYAHLLAFWSVQYCHIFLKTVIMGREACGQSWAVSQIDPALLRVKQKFQN